MDDAAKKKYIDMYLKEKEKYDKEVAAAGGKKPAAKKEKEEEAASRKPKPSSKDESINYLI